VIFLAGRGLVKPHLGMENASILAGRDQDERTYYPMQDFVEFIGGPYDGYRHRLDCMPAGIFKQAALPVSENLIRAVTGEKHGPLLPCHRVAVYRLHQSEEKWKYRFIGEMATEKAASAR
jgi:hypothetical protein